jgi:glycosyltransferase involved in cell wall biosynthesis
MTALVSVIIPAKSITRYLKENIAAVQSGTLRNFEIIVVLDAPAKQKFPKSIVIAAGHIGPAQKRDIGAQHAKGDILAFVDDDTIPSKHWLECIIKLFRDQNVGAVGGPGVTAPNVPWNEEASGWVSASPLGSDGFLYRFLPMKRRVVDDYPSMNLTVRRSDFEAVGGFDSNFWPGEDTKLCHDIVYTLGKKIIYEPEALVYHHRRPLWLPHLRQNGNFGVHRGYFARILPKTSARPMYFTPSLFALIVFYAGVRLVIPYSPQPNSIIYSLDTLSLIGTGIYGVLLILNGAWIAYRSKKIIQGLVSVPAVCITHLWYGVRFLQGFFLTRKLTT